MDLLEHLSLNELGLNLGLLRRGNVRGRGVGRCSQKFDIHRPAARQSLLVMVFVVYVFETFRADLGFGHPASWHGFCFLEARGVREA